MKKITVLVLVAGMLVIESCGGKGGDDSKNAEAAKTYCECIKTGTPECMKKIEDMDAGFKKDPKSYESFRASAIKICPDAQPEIEAMKPQ